MGGERVSSVRLMGEPETPGRDMRRPPDVSVVPRDQKLGPPTFIFQDGAASDDLQLCKDFTGARIRTAARSTRPSTTRRLKGGDEFRRSPAPVRHFRQRFLQRSSSQDLEIVALIRLADAMQSS
jgi:hypothetical protein